MILVIRGHVRKTFENKKFYELVKKINLICNLNQEDLHIYIHTWNVFSTNISWRIIDNDYNLITKEIIYNYFGDLQHLIKHIIIDDDKQIELIGNLNGNINNYNMPIIGWKRYWYGKYRIINYLYNVKKINNEQMIVNLRFDVLDNSNSKFLGIFDFDIVVLFFITNNMCKKFEKNKFYFEGEIFGIDNIYIGNINTMYKLTNYFHYNLDEIISKNTDVFSAEKLVYRINNLLDYK